MFLLKLILVLCIGLLLMTAAHFLTETLISAFGLPLTAIIFLFAGMYCGAKIGQL